MRMLNKSSSLLVFYGMMLSRMLAVRLAKNQIFYSIVIFYPVNMMHSFAFLDIPSNFFFHYKTMLSNITIIITKWMKWRSDKNISEKITRLTTMPTRVAFWVGSAILRVARLIAECPILPMQTTRFFRSYKLFVAKFTFHNMNIS